MKIGPYNSKLYCFKFGAFLRHSVLIKQSGINVDKRQRTFWVLQPRLNEVLKKRLSKTTAPYKANFF